MNKHIALAKTNCASCAGTAIRMDGKSLCLCVYRAICRAVLAKVRECSAGRHLVPMICNDGSTRVTGKGPYGRKNEEFIADIYLTAKRSLTPGEWRIFKGHHLLGNEWKRFGCGKVEFFRAVYRIEAKLGKIFLELKPYPLYPIDEYFSATSMAAPIQPCKLPCEKHANGVPLRPPLARKLKVVKVRERPVRNRLRDAA